MHFHVLHFLLTFNLTEVHEWKKKGSRYIEFNTCQALIAPCNYL